MAATQDDMIAELQRVNAELKQQLDARTAELRENKERYALASQAVAEGIYDWDIERNALWVSPRLLEIFGLREVGTSPADWNARIHPDDFDGYRLALHDCFKGTAARLACEYRIRLTSGNYCLVEDHGLPIRNSAGRVIRLAGAVSDITTRKETERALRASEERHALAMEAINEAVYEWYIDSGEMYYSPRLPQTLGLTPEQLRTRMHWVDRVHPDDLRSYQMALIAHFKGHTPRLECEYRYRHPDGQWHWARQHGVALFDVNRRAYRMAGSISDITAEKALARDLERARLQLHDAIESLSEGFALFDPEDRLVVYNFRYARFFHDVGGVELKVGMKFENVMREGIARGMFPLAEPDSDAWLAALLERRLHAAGIREEQVGSTMSLQISDRRTKDGSLVSVYTDITDLKCRQEELARLNVELRQSEADTKLKTAALVAAKEGLKLQAERENLNKSKFLADAAHDLRQPMQALSNYLEAADIAAQRSDILKCAELIGMSQSALRLARSSFRDILELSRFESGFVKAEHSSFDVEALLDEVLSQVRGAAEERRVQVRVRRRGSGPPLVVRSDRHLLGRVLMNLVSNAIKYQDERKGDAAAVLIGAIGFASRVRVDVVDNGVGIPRDQWDNIFKPFTQINNLGRDHEKGVGLGLSIVNAILPLLDGHRLDMNSAEGRGTRFSLEMPRTETTAQAVAEVGRSLATSLDLAGLYVLCVEDDALVRDSNASLFDAYGVLHEDVASVSELQERLPTLERMPDLIMTDYRLPDGCTAEDVLKAVWREYERLLPTIVLTGEVGILEPDTWSGSEVSSSAAPCRTRSLMSLGTEGSLVRTYRKPIAPGVLLEEISTLSRSGSHSLA